MGLSGHRGGGRRASIAAGSTRVSRPRPARCAPARPEWHRGPRSAQKNGDARAVIMITADPQLDDVKAALKLGAYDFVGKPLDFDELAVTTKNALEATKLKTEVEQLRGEMRRHTGYHNVI